MPIDKNLKPFNLKEALELRLLCYADGSRFNLRVIDVVRHGGSFLIQVGEEGHLSFTTFDLEGRQCFGGKNSNTLMIQEVAV